MRSPRRGFGRLATYLLLYAMCRFAFFCIKSTFNLIAQEHIRVRCNEMEQSDISLQRIAVSEVPKPEGQGIWVRGEPSPEPDTAC